MTVTENRGYIDYINKFNSSLQIPFDSSHSSICTRKCQWFFVQKKHSTNCTPLLCCLFREYLESFRNHFGFILLYFELSHFMPHSSIAPVVIFRALTDECQEDFERNDQHKNFNHIQTIWSSIIKTSEIN